MAEMVVEIPDRAGPQAPQSRRTQYGIPRCRQLHEVGIECWIPTEGNGVDVLRINTSLVERLEGGLDGWLSVGPLESRNTFFFYDRQERSISHHASCGVMTEAAAESESDHVRAVQPVGGVGLSYRRTVSWDRQSTTWATVAADERLDPFFWRVNRPALAEFLPDPRSGLVLDVGTGEGRVLRLLAERGHSAVGIDPSTMLLRAAPDDTPRAAGQGAALPIASESVEGVTCLMVLMSVDHYLGVIAEMARVLAPGGWTCLGVLHPLVTSGVIDDAGVLSVTSYGVTRGLSSREVVRGDHVLRFKHIHRPVAAYLQGTIKAGLHLEAVAEPLPSRSAVADHVRLRRWATTPNSLLWRARKR